MIKKLIFIIIFIFVCSASNADWKTYGDHVVEDDLVVGGKVTVGTSMTVESMSSAGFVKNDASGKLSGGNSIDISSDTNLQAGSNLTLSGDTINLDGDISLSTINATTITGDNLNISNWNTAYGWGDHALQNYFDKDTDDLDDVPEGTTYKRLTATKNGYLDQDVTSGSTPIFGDIKGETKPIIVTILDPNGAYDIDTQIPLMYVKSNLTVTRIEVSLDATGNDVAWDIKYADNLTSFTNAAVINDFDTASGVRSDSSISSGSVSSGKWMYLQFDSQPNSAITFMNINMFWDYD